MDEREGPFTDAEMRLIRNELNAGLADHLIDLRQAALAWLLIELDLRSSQISDLKVKDLEMKQLDDGATAYILQVPRVKQRGTRRRKQFKARELDPRIGQIVAAWCRQVVEDFGHRNIPASELPMFPCERRTVETDPGFKLHTDSKIIRENIISLFSTFSIISPRTNELMRFFPWRFRYTLGTRAVIYGAGAEVVAELLDHSDTQNVLVYTKFSDEIID